MGPDEIHPVCQSVRKHFFIVMVTEHSSRLPRELVESPSLEIFKTFLDTVLGSWLYVAVPEQVPSP